MYQLLTKIPSDFFSTVVLHLNVKQLDPQDFKAKISQVVAFQCLVRLKNWSIWIDLLILLLWKNKKTVLLGHPILWLF